MRFQANHISYLHAVFGGSIVSSPPTRRCYPGRPPENGNAERESTRMGERSKEKRRMRKRKIQAKMFYSMRRSVKSNPSHFAHLHQHNCVALTNKREHIHKDIILDVTEMKKPDCRLGAVSSEHVELSRVLSETDSSTEFLLHPESSDTCISTPPRANCDDQK